ncbi:MAG: MGMT family protein [Sphingobacteriaceae bacterium]
MSKLNFYERVYEVVRQIPAGRVTSYGAIAAFLGTKGASRVVGYAMGASGTAWPPVPAHRVLNRSGMLTGKASFDHQDLMQQMLVSEGVLVKDDQVMNFKNIFWDPAIEII